MFPAAKVLWKREVQVSRDEELGGEVIGGGRDVVGVVSPVPSVPAVIVTTITLAIGPESTTVEPPLAYRTIGPPNWFDKDAVVSIDELPITNVCTSLSQGQESGTANVGSVPCCSTPVQQTQLLLQVPIP